MSCQIINGKSIAQNILSNIALSISQLEKKPTLAVVLIGNNPASRIYVNNKKLASEKVGINSLEFHLPESTRQDEVLDLIDKLNYDTNVNGILVQLPLPPHLNNLSIIDKIVPNKDVDGFNRQNIGSLVINDSHLSPCTPTGIMYMLDAVVTEYKGLHAVVLGSSNIVGKPIAFELINRGSTVSVCNSKSKNTIELLSTADIVIAAIGKANFVQGAWLKDGVIAIDVGINYIDGKMFGDIDFASASLKASHISPVPGGVGPMTIAMLLSNTIKCYNLQLSIAT